MEKANAPRSLPVPTRDGVSGRLTRTGPETARFLADLSLRERQILESISSGQRVAAIADTLGISLHTVRNHLKSIFRKLGVRSQIELLGRFR